MRKKYPKVNVDILVIRGKKILLGLLIKKWGIRNRRVYGVPGRDIKFGEKISDAVKRNIKEEFGCGVKKFKVICLNANYALDNHYIGIGVTVEINGEAKLLAPQDWEKWEWFNKDQIPHNLFPATKNLIDCYLSHKLIVSQ